MIRRPGLRTALVAATAALVGIAVLVVGLRAIRLLERFAEQQALARVKLAGLAAAAEVERAGVQVATAAELLGTSPSLAPYLAADERALLEAFLMTFAETSGVDGCAVIGPDGIVSADPLPLPWGDIALGEIAAGAPWRWVEGAEAGPPVVVASREVTGFPGQRAVAARRIDRAFAAAVARQVSAPVEIVGLERALAGAGDRRAVLWGRAASEAVGGSGRVDEIGAFVHVEPLGERDGHVAALVETRLDTAEVDASVRQLSRLLLASTIGVGGLSVIAALWIGLALVRPLELLTEASARMGRGDFSVPVPRTGRAETGLLASTMEEMRVRLLELTKELARRRAQAEAVATGIVEGVWAVDRERRITWINPQAAAMFGIREEAALGRFCGDVLSPVMPGGGRPCEEHCPILDARFRGGARATERLRLAGGAERNVVITSAPPIEADPAQDTAFGQYQVVRDETEIEAARRLRDSVLANVSHEFSTPLSAQLASLELLRERLGEHAAADLVELVGSAERATLRLTRLVDNLLESLRIEAGREEIRRQSVEIDRIVEEATELVRPLMRQKDQRLEQDLPWPVPAIAADGPRLVQVFVNLLANASKFAPPGTTIRVGGESSERELTLWVEDEGPGLPEELGEPPFERFVRAAGEEPLETGMGLGLWIVNSIVTRHGGRVHARNTGTGARLTIVLPRARA